MLLVQDSELEVAVLPTLVDRLTTHSHDRRPDRATTPRLTLLRRMEAEIVR